MEKKCVVSNIRSDSLVFPENCCQKLSKVFLEYAVNANDATVITYDILTYVRLRKVSCLTLLILKLTLL